VSLFKFPKTFLGGLLPGLQREWGFFASLVTGDKFSLNCYWEKWSCRMSKDSLIQRRDLSSQQVGVKASNTVEPSGVQEPARGVLLIRLVRTQLQNQACLRREKRRLINSQ
jgi:hypothetical protein